MKKGNQTSQAAVDYGKLSAQFEHTVLVTDTGYEVLTLA
jgi:methionine aminopeptidase